MKQMSLAHTGFELVTKPTRKREFLDEMSLVIPWTELLTRIAPHPPAGKTGAHAAARRRRKVFFADSGYPGVQKREEIQTEHPDVDWQIAMMPDQRKAMDKSRPVNARRPNNWRNSRPASAPRLSTRFA